jgi:RNA methyltransferase, TrmH family
MHGAGGCGSAVIASTDHPLVKRIAASQREGRRGERLVVVEGRRAIDGVLAAGWRAEVLLVRDGHEPLASWQAVAMSERVCARLSQAATPSGYLGVFPCPVPLALDVAAGGLIAAGVADPGNLGTLLRTAAAFAVRQVVVAGGCDPWSAKVVQAAAGCLPLLAIHDSGPAPACAGGAPRCALVVSGGAAPSAVMPGPRWLVVGSEAHGVPGEWLAACEERLSLPMPGGTESLNAAVAGAIALWALGPGRIPASGARGG